MWTPSYPYKMHTYYKSYNKLGCCGQTYIACISSFRWKNKWDSPYHDGVHCTCPFAWLAVYILCIGCIYCRLANAIECICCTKIHMHLCSVCDIIKSLHCAIHFLLRSCRFSAFCRLVYKVSHISNFVGFLTRLEKAWVASKSAWSQCMIARSDKFHGFS